MEVAMGSDNGIDGKVWCWIFLNSKQWQQYQFEKQHFDGDKLI
jgi:hypothetical protein